MGYSKNSRAVRKVYEHLTKLDGSAHLLPIMGEGERYALRNGIAALGDNLEEFPELRTAHEANYRFVGTKDGILAVPRAKVVPIAPPKAALIAPGNAVAALHLVRTIGDQYDTMEFTLDEAETVKLLEWQEKLNLNVTMETIPTGVMVKKERHAK